MVLSFAVISNSSVRHLPTLAFALEPVPAVVPVPPELVEPELVAELVPAEFFAPPWSELPESEPPPEGDAVAPDDPVDVDDGSLCPVPASSFWQAVSERPAATARAAKVSL
jgi:hypothetical protein